MSNSKLMLENDALGFNKYRLRAKNSSYYSCDDDDGGVDNDSEIELCVR
jgi:hypothetical protein